MKKFLLFLLLLLGASSAAQAQPPSPTQCVTTVAAGGTGDQIQFPTIPCWPTTTLVIMKVGAANVTTTPAISVNGGTFKTVVNYDGSSIPAGTFQPGQYRMLAYNGTNWLALSAGVVFNVNGFVVTPTNATLKAITGSTNGETIYRAGFYSAGDGGDATYTFSSTNCTISGGDNGKQVQPSVGSGCYNVKAQPAYDWRIWGAQAEGTLGYQTTPIDPAGTFDSTAAINAALATGFNIIAPPGMYHITQPLVCSGFGQTITGVGRTQSIIDVGSDMNLTAAGELIVGNNGPNVQTSCEVHKVGIQFYQNPADTTRAQLIHYPWAITCVAGTGGAAACGRVVLDQVRISRGWDCINLPNNSGGWWWGRLELGCFDQGIQADGTLDYSHIDSIEVWPYGLEGSPNLNASGIWGDGSTSAGNLGNVQGLQVDKFSIFDASLTITGNNTSSEGMIFGKLQLDNLGQLHISGGKVQIGELDTGISNAQTIPAVLVDGTYTTTRVSVSNYYNTSGPNATATFLVTGGAVNISGGIAAAGGATGGVDSTMFEVTNTTGFALLKLTGLYIKPKSGSNLTKSIVVETGGTSAQLIMDGDTFENGAGSTGTMINIGFDGQNNYISNVSGLTSWGSGGVVLGFVPTLGYYDFGNYKFTLTPTIAFATNGDYAPTGFTSTGNYYLRGNYVEVLLNASWTNNAYTTASGVFQVSTNLPPPPVGFPTPGEPLLVTALSGVTYGTSPQQFPCNGWINGSSIIALAVCATGAVTSGMTTTNLPPSAAESFVMSGRYTIH